MENNSNLGELVPCGGGDPIPLLKPQLLVGRRSSCDIKLRFPNVSSQHCELDFQDGYWRVRDLGSRNGIKVNGDRCESKWLMPGDELSVAKHRYEIQYTPQGDTPPPQEEDPFEIGLLEKAGLARRKPQPPPATRKTDPSQKKKFDLDEDQAMKWLNDDSE